MMRAWVGLVITAMVWTAVAGCGGPGGASRTSHDDIQATSLLDGRAEDALDARDPLLDRRGDVSGGVDFDTVRVGVEDGRLLFRVGTGETIGLQNGSGLQLHLDLDPEHATELAGQSGAELVWVFGQREGFLASDTGDVEFGHAALGLITAPTVTSDLFEIGLDLAAQPAGQPLFRDMKVGIAFYDSRSGDRIPDEGFEVVDLHTDAGEPSLLPTAKTDDSAVRLVAWNVLWDGITERPETFDPVIDVLQPDIVILSEVWDTPAEVAVELFNEWIPRADSMSWHGAKQGADIIAVSRYPVLDSWPIDGARAGAFLIELPEPFTEPLFVIGAHPPCCGKNDERQREIDAIMAFVRDARQGTGIASIPDGSAIAIAGDMNLVGYDEQLETFIHGRIVNTDRYGDPFPPDSDGSSLVDLFPRHLQDNVVYTWRQDDSRYGPGKLDYVFIGDADLSVAHSYVFDTRLLDAALLSELGLAADASPAASDHLPVVVDLLPAP